MADAGKLIIKIDGDNSGLNKSLQGIDKIGKIGLAGLASAAGTLAAGFGYAVKVGSEFESQMSTVGAISGASAEDMGVLTEKAKEMGIVSAFSATEAGKAFEYMAMAGWKTSDMLNGIEGVMNLAAASGEDLGMVADIVTDGLTAFGLAASESARFADVLAAAATNSNTNVAMLGESFKYVAPVAGALGYTIEDTAVALGLMANSGIKSSQAGTTLRSVLARMANPVENTERAMAELGLSLTDSSGKMKPLNELLVDMRKGFSNLNTEQKASYASMLGGKQALSGLLAIVNASESDFNKLTNAIADSTGKAEEMAEIKLDNLKGQVTLLGSSFEGAGIAVYDKFSEPMKNGVKSAITSVNTLTRSISGGGLGTAIEGLGEQVGDLIASFAKFATNAIPPLIDGLSWLIENLGTLARVAAAAVVAFKTFTIVTSVTKLVQGFSASLSAYSTATAAAAAGSAAAASAQVFMAASMSASELIVGVLTGKITLATAAQHLFNASLLANPAVFMTAAIVALTAAFAVWVITSNEATEEEKARQKAIDETIQKTDELTASIKQQDEAYKKNLETITENGQAKIIELDQTKQLADELLSLADSKGKVAESDKARAKVILDDINKALGTEYKLIDNQIQGYSELTDEVYKNIDAEKARAVVKVYSEMHEEALRREIEAKKAAAKATDILKDAESQRAGIVEEVRQKMEQMTGQIVTQEEAMKALADGSFVASQGVRESFEGQKASYDELGEKINASKEAIKTHGEVTAEVASLEMELNAVKLAAEKGNIEEIINTIRLSAEERKAIQEASATELLALITQNNEQIKFLEEQKAATQDENERKGWQSAIDTAMEKGKVLTDEYQKTNTQAEVQQNQHITNTIQMQKQSLDEQLAKQKGNSAEQEKTLNSHYSTAKQMLSDYAKQHGISTDDYTNEGIRILQAYVAEMEQKHAAGMDAIIADTEQKGDENAQLMGTKTAEGTGKMVFELGFAQPFIKAKSGELGKGGAQGFEENFDGNQLGRNAAEGVSSGLSSKLDSLRAMGASMANAVNNAFKAALDINSPSRVMRKDGQDAGEGAVLGVADMIPKMIATAGRLANGFKESFEDGQKLEFEPEISIPEKFFGAGVDSGKAFSDGFNSEFNKALMGIQAKINTALASATPHVGIAGVTGGSRSIDNSRTITQSPTLVFNEPVNSPDVVARRVNSVMRYGLAGER